VLWHSFSRCSDCSPTCDNYDTSWQEELRQRHDAFESGLKALREEKHRIESELKRLVETIAVGKGSPTVMAPLPTVRLGFEKSQTR
jgi:hypothetical protein